MTYYDEWFEENWCKESREEETALIEAIKEGVRQDIKSEMERLRKENAELQQYKQERQEIENIKKWYESRLQTEVEAYKRTLRQEKIKELFGDYICTGWGVDHDDVLPPKCNKCDDDRCIHFKSPSGKDFKEPCSCSKAKKIYKPVELSLIEFNDYENKIRRYFIEEGKETYGQYGEGTSRIYDGKVPFEDLNCWRIVFLDKETCEKYCVWKTEQEAKKNA